LSYGAPNATRFFLRDLGNERNPTCPLTMVESIEAKPVTRKQLGWPSMVVAMAFGGALARRTLLAAAV
jgi:hypothetical protein